ncbi:MAG: HAMP domain-containing sensor histidine kinase, partial [Gemmatimonadaceae bacterium]
SHELRTPLNAIAGYAELIEMGLRGPVTAEQLKDLNRIQESQRHLLGLINSILNFAKLEAGQVQFNIGRIKLSRVLNSVEALTAPQMASRRLRYAIGACDAELFVLADEEKLRQILLNLLSNSVKFTEPTGSVSVECSEEDGTVSIKVADSGRGISEDHLASIFEPFVQVGRDVGNQASGVGLGLAISRDLARQMGGELSAASTPGVGSQFTVTLRRADGDGQPSES